MTTPPTQPVSTIFRGQASRSTSFVLVIEGDCNHKVMANVIRILSAQADVMADVAIPTLASIQEILP